MKLREIHSFRVEQPLVRIIIIKIIIIIDLYVHIKFVTI